MTGLDVPVGLSVWLGLAILFGIIEIATVGFLFAFFAGGALVTALVSLFVDSMAIQIVVFVAASLLLVIYARPILRRTFQVGDKPRHDSNVGALAGSEVLVLEPVDKYTGRVKVVHTGEVWSAYMAPDFAEETLPENSPGLIEKVDGAKLVVRPKADG